MNLKKKFESISLYKIKGDLYFKLFLFGCNLLTSVAEGQNSRKQQMKAEKAFKVAVSLLNTTTQKLPHGTKRNANCNPVRQLS